MSSTNSVDAILAGAKKTLGDANKFTQSVEGNPTAAFAPKHEFAKAPYSLAHKAAAPASPASPASPKPASYGEDVGTGIKSRVEMEKKALGTQ